MLIPRHVRDTCLCWLVWPSKAKTQTSKDDFDICTQKIKREIKKKIELISYLRKKDFVVRPDVKNQHFEI